MAIEISDKEFVDSFLKAARLRKMSVVVIYGTTNPGRAVLRLVTNAGKAATEGVLSWIRSQAPQVESVGEDEPPASPILSS